MAIVQRWLAATRRRPTPFGVHFAWIAENCQTPDEQFLFGSLPIPLFVQLSTDAEGCLGFHAPGILLFVSIAAAETALEEAWIQAVQPRWFRSAWKPEFHLKGVEPQPSPTTRQTGFIRNRLSVGQTLVWFLVLLLWMLMKGCLAQSKPEYPIKPVDDPLPQNHQRR